MGDLIPVSADYLAFLEEVKGRVRSARASAALAANQELLLLYWNIGRGILARQQALGWGAKVTERLARDLRHEFPDLKGFSGRNLRYMRTFAAAWSQEPIGQQLLPNLPWFHICLILDKVNEPSARQFYVEQAAQQGWSRATLRQHIERGLHTRQGQAITNFATTLSPADSSLAIQTLKDPYIFDFLGLGQEAQERDVEQRMVQSLKHTLVELGVGFAFVGQQVRLEVAGDEFFLDLLFYHVRLHRYVVVELKGEEFAPEHAGKLNFYLSAVDDLIRDRAVDGPTIGLLLCKGKNRVLAEYALRDIQKPIGVADLQLTRLVPEDLRSSLPTVEELESELSDLAATDAEKA